MCFYMKHSSIQGKAPFRGKEEGQVHRSAPPDKATHVITVQSDICAQQLRGSSIWNVNRFLFAKQSEPSKTHWRHVGLSFPRERGKVVTASEALMTC